MGTNLLYVFGCLFFFKHSSVKLALKFIFSYNDITKVSFGFLWHNNESMFFSTSKILGGGLPIA